MTVCKKERNEQQVSLKDLFDVYDQLAPWDQFKFHLFLNSDSPQDMATETPLDWLMFKAQIGFEIHSTLEVDQTG